MRPAGKMLIWLTLGAILFVATGWMGGALREPVKAYRMAEDVNDPEMGIVNAIPGGIRAPIISALWYRSQTLKNMNRNYDAVQMSSLMCKLQPYFPTIWAFQAWDMYANRSVQARTPDERWLWIDNAIKLLRDEALPKNKRSLILYKELSWIYYFKLGGDSDEMQYQLKQRMVGQMHRLVGNPPTGEFGDVADAFAPIADSSFIDRSVQPGRQIVQRNKLDELLKDPAVAQYAAKLAALKVFPVVYKDQLDTVGKVFDENKNQMQVDDAFLATCSAMYDEKGSKVAESLLGAYNRLAKDDNVSLSRWMPVVPQTDQDKELSALINAQDKDAVVAERMRAARDRIIAFIRAQIFWNVYRMDPAVMLDMMRKYELPLDWRHPYSHSLYWAMVGADVAKAKTETSINSLNLVRNILNSLKGLTENGRITCKENPSTPLYPDIWLVSDPRYIEPTVKAHMEIMEGVARKDGTPVWQNTFADGFIVYMISAIQILVAENRIDEAQREYEFVKTEFRRSGGFWVHKDVRDFVVMGLMKEFVLTENVAFGQISSSLVTAYRAMVRGDNKTFQTMYAYAKRVFDAWYKQAAERKKVQQTFGIVVTNVLVGLIGNPESYGINLTLLERSEIYNRIDNEDKKYVYSMVGQWLSAACKVSGIDFDKAFPKPAGYDEFIKKQIEARNAVSGKQPGPTPR